MNADSLQGLFSLAPSIYESYFLSFQRFVRASENDVEVVSAFITAKNYVSLIAVCPW